ncbi:MAG: thioesterase family protein [Acidimicrobiales bacterium]|nr:thioesterase family protein [Acidimicrobiales bacterium]
MEPASPAETAEGARRLVVVDQALRARAWWGDTLVAESTATVRVEEDGVEPTLWFPAGDVRADLLVDEGRRVSCPVKGEARLWSLAGTIAPGQAGQSARGWAAEAPPRTDGSDVAWGVDEPSAAAVALAGLVSFDHDRVRVELVDDWDTEDPRGVVTLGFPNWGDAVDLVEILDVHHDGDRRWLGSGRFDAFRPVVEGSQMLGQAMVAAARHSGGRRVVSAHMVFTRPGDARRPLEFELDEITHGRTFTAVGVRVTQGGRTCAAGTLLLDETAPDLIRHEDPGPDAAGPYESPPYDMSVTGRALRIVDDAYDGSPDAPVGPPEIDAWVKFREVPDDRALHAGLLAQFTGHLSIAAAMRPHAEVNQHQAHRTVSTAINAIALSVHADVHADRWMRYRHLSTFAGDGMTRSECRVYDLDGRLVASFSVDAMVRAMTHAGTVDHRTAL